MRKELYKKIKLAIKIIIIVIGLITIPPFLLNKFILYPSIWPVAGGQNADAVWLGFWATYLSSIASFAMVYCTWLSLKELKRQWDEEHQPEIDIIPIYKDEYICLQVRNISKSYAKRIKFNIQLEYIENIPYMADSDKLYLKNLNNKYFSLMPIEHKEFLLFKFPLLLPEETKIYSICGTPYWTDSYRDIFKYMASNHMPLSCELNSENKLFTVNISDAFLGDYQVRS